MINKYFKLISLSAIILLSGVSLAGCGNQPNSQPTPADESQVNSSPSELPAQNSLPTQTVEDTTASLDQTVGDLDASIKTIETTGFEASNLADKDLGL